MSKHVALNFEVGGDPQVCGQMLDILSATATPVTLFLPGNWSEQYPELVRRMSADGHEFGNHSYTHPDLTQMDDDEIRAELQRTDDLVQQLTGRRAFPWFRPPYDAVDAHVIGVAHEQGYRLIQRNAVDGGHWPGETTPERVLKRSLENAYDGAVITYHLDSLKTLAVLRQIIEQLGAADVQFVTLSALPSVEERPERREDFAGLEIEPGYLQVLKRGARAWSMNVLEFGARVNSTAASPLALIETDRWSASVFGGRLAAQPAAERDRYLFVLAGMVECLFRTRDDPEICVRALGRPGDCILWPRGCEFEIGAQSQHWMALVFE
ncbi:MAG TPA: polysaccharide deacetylase family protein [Phototrophicaceae bacterium]|nr:polysaccharide deacetylase family protein [Phototrophicaceae bacterium]